jgi:SET domain-containing protein
MLLVPTLLGPSQIHGIGVFAETYIGAGSLVCEFARGVDQTWTADEVLLMPEHAQSYLYKYLWWNPTIGEYVLDVDDARYINHSSSPNLVATEVAAIAYVDIYPGDELTVDYRLFCRETDILFDTLKKKLSLEDDPFMNSILKETNV